MWMTHWDFKLSCKHPKKLCVSPATVSAQWSMVEERIAVTANVAIEEPTFQTFEGVPPSVEPPKSTTFTDGDISGMNPRKLNDDIAG